MAMVQKPTKAQLRQHALDRALSPEVVREIGQYSTNSTTVESLADDIIKVADRFAAYLEGEEEPTDGN